MIKQCQVCDEMSDIRSRSNRCGLCAKGRACVSCKIFGVTNGTQNKCGACYRKLRSCTECGSKFRGVKSLCNHCRYNATRDQRKHNWDRWVAANPQYKYERAQAHLMKKYGIDAMQYHLLHEQCGGVCMICKQPESALDRWGKPKRLSVDHDHNTGFIRGLLCARCNPALGLFADNPELLRQAAQYLDQAAARQAAQDREAEGW